MAQVNQNLVHGWNNKTGETFIVLPRNEASIFQNMFH